MSARRSAAGGQASADSAPAFPGGTSLSHLRVYDWPTPDGAGLAGGGTPHLHTASAEGYVVLSGAGSVQTLAPSGYAETMLVPGVVAWFTPGVVHRLVNDGGLEILVVMSNAGLPEAGDAVFTFPAEVLGDEARYRAAAASPVGKPGAGVGVDSSEDSGEDDDVVGVAVRVRRDLALEGFATLRARVEREGPAGLDDLYAAAAKLVADRIPRWHEIWSAGPAQQTVATAQALSDLANGTAPHLAAAAMATTGPRPGPRRYGMCGRLQTWPI